MTDSIPCFEPTLTKLKQTLVAFENNYYFKYAKGTVFIQ